VRMHCTMGMCTICGPRAPPLHAMSRHCVRCFAHFEKNTRTKRLTPTSLADGVGWPASPDGLPGLSSVARKRIGQADRDGTRNRVGGTMGGDGRRKRWMPCMQPRSRKCDATSQKCNVSANPHNNPRAVFPSKGRGLTLRSRAVRV
jgi:hypothetical protein